MGLSQAQMDHWHSQGYLVFKQLLAEEIGWITEEFEKVVPGGDNDMAQNVARSGYSKQGGMRPYDGTQTTTIVPTIDRSARLCGLRAPRNSQWCAQTGAWPCAEMLDRRTDSLIRLLV